MTSRQAVLEKGKAITRAQVEDFLFFEARSEEHTSELQSH